MKTEYIFSDRETYLAATKRWKADYAALTVTQRVAKLTRRSTESAWAKSPVSTSFAAPEFREYDKALSAVFANKSRANEMLEARQAMKTEAGRQMREQANA